MTLTRTASAVLAAVGIAAAAVFGLALPTGSAQSDLARGSNTIVG